MLGSIRIISCYLDFIEVAFCVADGDKLTIISCFPSRHLVYVTKVLKHWWGIFFLLSFLGVGGRGGTKECQDLVYFFY